MGFSRSEVSGIREKPITTPVDSAQSEKPIDTSSTTPEPIDIFCSYPAQELYDDWDNMDIHPYHFDPVLFFDTLRIPLTDANDCGFTSPIQGHITSNFGYRKYRYHHGIDVDLYSGDPVKSAFNGVVRIARYSSSYGYVVVIRHPTGLETLYAHMSQLKVKADQTVHAGDVIGLGGRTGRATGSHLHFELRYKGWSLDPAEIINFEAGTLRNAELVLDPSKLKHLTRYASGYHTVQIGEDPCTIADEYGLEVEDLCDRNNMTMTSHLQPGQKVKIR